MLNNRFPANPYLLSFQTDVSAIELPVRFTFPFNYTPHELCRIAAMELQNYLRSPKDWEYDFGMNDNSKGMGKMFGVLVVKNQEGKMGYLAAFSGKLLDKTDHKYFVPPVFDTLAIDGFFKKGEEAINMVNREVEKLLNETSLVALENDLTAKKIQATQELNEAKKQIKESKNNRKEQREAAKSWSETAQQTLFAKLDKESAIQNIAYKTLNKQWQATINTLENALNQRYIPIQALKEKRKKMSFSLQKQLFESYVFLNKDKKTKDIAAIFNVEEGAFPPSGAGECAAPKLLQYSFQNDLEPIAMAEFWWGAAPSSEIRKHGYFYPACKSKCKPILTYMLEGTLTDPDPMLKPKITVESLEVCYEDDALVVIHKPEGLLSVPGKNLEDSVTHQMRKKYPDATGPLVVHRLDQDTSGLMIVAKSEAVYHHLQVQFLKKTIKKRYVALLDGVLEQENGVIELPIRGDLDNRPRQLVCYEYGKIATTEWKKVSEENGKTRIHLYPITGRTHQLRIHASHQKGLNTAILGDDLYGTRKQRLYLHAEEITFDHPVSKNRINIVRKADF